MTAWILGSGLPLIALALGAVVAMLLAPLAEIRIVRLAAAAAFTIAIALAAWHTGAPGLPAMEMLRDDGIARFGILLVCLTGLATLAFLRPGLPAKEAPALSLMATLGAAVLCAANHAATVFLGLELVTLSLIAMFVLPLTRTALEAGYKFLILGGVGAATLLFAFALVYAATGKLSLDVWSQRGLLVSLGAALLLAGFAFKFSLAPFHMWTPDVFSGAPAAAAAFAGAGSKIAVALALLRIDAAGPPEPAWSLGLAAMGSASVVLGSLVALRQTSLTRMLGYSSIAHSGYLALILASGAASGSEAILFYLAAYAPALIAALCVAALAEKDATLEGISGLIWRQPLAGGTLVLALLSLTGLPPSAGFLAKYFLFAALVQAQAWVTLAVAVLGSALGLYFYIRFAAAAFRQDQAEPVLALCWPDTVLLALCALLILAIGIYPAPLIDAVRFAVQ